MRIAIGAIVIFLLSFGGVYLFTSPAKAPMPVDIATILNAQPDEYFKIYRAFQVINAPELNELDKSLLAFHEHENVPALRKEFGGLMLRVIRNKSDNLLKSGRPWLEKLSRKTLALTRRYQTYGFDFCDATIRNDFASGEKFLHENLQEKQASELIAEFKQARFELAILALEATAEGSHNPVSVPWVDEDAINSALVQIATKEQARVLATVRNDYRDCNDIIVLLELSLKVADNDTRHAVLALMNRQG